MINSIIHESSTINELMKCLQYYFIEHKTYNLSLLKQLCESQKLHSSITIQQIQNKLKILDEFFILIKNHGLNDKIKKQNKSQLFQSKYYQEYINMLTIFIFNISAVNQHHMIQLTNQMAQSTASSPQQINSSSLYYKDKQAINLLKQNLRYYYQVLTSQAKFINEIISQIQNQSQINQSQRNFLQTIDYLCIKYTTNNQISERIIKILQQNQVQSDSSNLNFYNNDIVKQTNKIIFTSSKQQEFYEILQLNIYVDTHNLLNIIANNYFHKNPPRKIFSSGQISGSQVIQKVFSKIIKKIGKNQLFNQKNQEYMPFRFFISHLLVNHFDVYFRFNNLIMRRLLNSYGIKNSQFLQRLNQIEKFLRIFITIQNPLFRKLVQFIFNKLNEKTSFQSAFELMKKFLLNRFLLNPILFKLYFQPSQKQLNKYIDIANFVRTLFYPNKTQQLSQKLQNPHLIQISRQILDSLYYCLKSQLSTKNQKNTQIFQIQSHVYINDKIIKSQMQKFYNEIHQKSHNKQEINIKNMISEYSLSFSLIKNQPSKNNLNSGNPIIMNNLSLQNVSEVKLPNTNRSNLINKDNNSVRFMYEQLKGLKSQNLINQQQNNNNQQQKQTQNKNVNLSNLKAANVSTQTRLHSVTLPTQRQILEQLVEIRQYYGQRRSNLKLTLQNRHAKSQKRLLKLKTFSRHFNEQKQQIERQNDLLHIHMTTAH